MKKLLFVVIAVAAICIASSCNHVATSNTNNDSTAVQVDTVDTTAIDTVNC